MIHLHFKRRALANVIRAQSSTLRAVRGNRYKPTTSKAEPSRPSHERRVHPILRGIAWAAALFLTGHIVTEYVVSYGTCDGISMLPTINSFGDAVLISKYYRRGRGVKVGDIISYTHPIIPEIKGLKRIVGMEGDFVLRDTPGLGLDESEEKMLQVCYRYFSIV